MGLVLLFFTYLIVGLVMFIAGPLLFRFATKKFGKFKDNTWKKHGLFWLGWCVLNGVITYVQSAMLENGFTILSLMNSVWLLVLAIHIGLCMAIFRVQFVPALKASLSYFVLFTLTFAVVAFLAIQFSFHEIIMGGR